MAQPGWISKITQMYSDEVAHAFVVYGNIHDYVAPGVRLAQYLSSAFGGRMFIEYSLAGGITFRSAADRKRMMAIVRPDTGNGASQQAADIFAAIGVSAPKSDRDDDSKSVAAPLAEAVDLLYQMATAKDDGKFVQPIILIHDGDMIVPPADKATLQSADRLVLAKVRGWGNDGLLETAAPLILMAVSSLGDLSQDIVVTSSKWESVNVPMPTAEGRLDYVERALGRDDLKFDLEDGMTPRKLANLTAGLSLVHIEDVILTASRAGKLTSNLVADRKRAIIESMYGGMLIPGAGDVLPEHVGGHELIKDFFMNEVVGPLAEGDYLNAVKGVLLLGPSGTGKSLLAKMLASMSGMNFAEMNIGGIADKYQGEGEKKLDRALGAVLAMSPSVVFIDEIDQVTGRGSSSNQQDARIFQKLLTFTADPAIRGKVVFVYGSNRPDLIDAAFMRPGRIDAIIPVLPPTDDERPEIVAVHVRRYMGVECSPSGISAEIVEMSDGWTGAEIESAVRKAAKNLKAQSGDVNAALKIGFTKIVANTRDIERMTRLAIDSCNDLDLLPLAYRKRAEEKREEIEEPAAPRERTGRRSLA